MGKAHPLALRSRVIAFLRKVTASGPRPGTSRCPVFRVGQNDELDAGRTVPGTRRPNPGRSC